MELVCYYNGRRIIRKQTIQNRAVDIKNDIWIGAVVRTHVAEEPTGSVT